MLKECWKEFLNEPEIKKVRICFYMIFCVLILLWLHHGDAAEEFCACIIGIIVSFVAIYFLLICMKRKYF